ncbi:hypothetical protein [Peribacillus butanolivorans]|uniref:hypothetical protein n=1 Tax=Peribacillus butanolivorans TaxID=421767 RepID=UPI00167FAE13|nr:hypothetical protein [Peribacillus butanolivorans]QNU03207.1 hypothetical protein GM240_04090 [Peribacillus butanolivorans]
MVEVLKQESTPDIGVFSDRPNKTVEEVFKMIVDNSKELALYVNSLTEINNKRLPCGNSMV